MNTYLTYLEKRMLYNYFPYIRRISSMTLWVISIKIKIRKEWFLQVQSKQKKLVFFVAAKTAKKNPLQFHSPVTQGQFTLKTHLIRAM